MSPPRTTDRSGFGQFKIHTIGMNMNIVGAALSQPGAANGFTSTGTIPI